MLAGSVMDRVRGGGDQAAALCDAALSRDRDPWRRLGQALRFTAVNRHQKQ